ncbi:hypothetical protein [Proteiniphilum sp. UBA1028]|jgi:hypothetical protein|uniref:hypothetical protein n=1 Tax=Proteiniphilum sp. UBA1028 TaxID=1947251 RepID=UPI0025E9FF00|nr:hypothetical protein [Proteiniphilum sp. UBA1028]
MGDYLNIRQIFRNPAFGLIPLIVFSFLVSFTDSWASTGGALLLSLIGYVAVRKQSRLIYMISIVVFAIATMLSFGPFANLHAINRFVVVEVIFILALVAIRLSRGKIVKRLGKTRNLMLKNYLKESFRVAFQTQYGLSILVLLVLLPYLFDNSDWLQTQGSFIMIVSQVTLVAIVLLEEGRLSILRRRLVCEEWLPVVTERGEVTGRVAKSITKDLKNRFMHPVVRVALIHKGSIYLQERDPSRLLNPGMLDYPFEKYMQYNDDIDETVRRSIAQECGSNDLPLRFLLKYTFENEATKRLIFLYVSDVEDEVLYNSLRLKGGKLWTEAQIEDNMGNRIFSECFELEFEYLKNTVLLASRFRDKQ